VAVRHAQHSASNLEETLRRQKPPIVGRVEQNEFIIDLRTVGEDQDDKIAQAFEQIQ
jgi:L-seryl-tRNA(Ser) seleniumtransferase